MKFLKLLAVVPVVGAIAAFGLVGADQLNLGNPINQAGSDTTLQCDADGFQLYFQNNWNTDAFYTQGVSVAGIDSDCAGHVIKVELTHNGASIAEGHGTTVLNQNLQVDFVPAPLASEVTDVHVSIQ